MPHEGDDGSPEDKLLLRLLLLRLRLRNNFRFLVNPASLFTFFAFKDETVHFTDFFRDFRLNRLVRCNKHFQLYQVGHDFESLHPHLFGKVTDDDGRLDANHIPVH